MSPNTRALVVCPLRFEQRALLRQGIGDFCDVKCCGPGATAVRAWASSVEIAQPNSRLVILAGLAGALTAELREGSAFFVDEVVEAQGQCRWRSPLAHLSGASLHSFHRATSEPATVTNRRHKITIRARTGADLVDLESIAFAQSASERRWLWAIVRGISDGVDTSLPEDLDQWVNRAGRTRLGAVMHSVMRRPALVPQVLALNRSSRSAMRASASIIRTLVARSASPG